MGLTGVFRGAFGRLFLLVARAVRCVSPIIRPQMPQKMPSRTRATRNNAR